MLPRDLRTALRSQRFKGRHLANNRSHRFWYCLLSCRACHTRGLIHKIAGEEKAGAHSILTSPTSKNPTCFVLHRLSPSTAPKPPDTLVSRLTRPTLENTPDICPSQKTGQSWPGCFGRCMTGCFACFGEFVGLRCLLLVIYVAGPKAAPGSSKQLVPKYRN